MHKFALTLTLLLFAATASSQVNGPITVNLFGVSSEALKWEWGASLGIDDESRTATSGPDGAADFQELKLTRYSDAQSPSLVQASHTGQVLLEVTVTRNNMTIILKDVFVSSYAVSGKPTSQNKPQKETVGLDAGRIIFSVDGQEVCINRIGANLDAQCE